MYNQATMTKCEGLEWGNANLAPLAAKGGEGDAQCNPLPTAALCPPPQPAAFTCATLPANLKGALSGWVASRVALPAGKVSLPHCFAIGNGK